MLISERKLRKTIKSVLLEDYEIQFKSVSDFVNEITKFSEIMEFRSISSLHDFILYVITPLLNHGSVDYDSDESAF